MTEPDEHWKQAADRLFDALEVEATPLPFCQVVLLDASECLQLLSSDADQQCPHRAPGPAPEALGEVITALRRDVAEAREIARGLAALTRYRWGDKGVDTVLHRLRLGPRQPDWLQPDMGWPLP
ncbi:hypothetical protein [Blastococcus sp. PRF04-17]|uniref:hypothetical protein n=1 Tax=Blastococcus sp. PRF04-17 TaxID=2933797 RepID=UPI001FF5D2AC|nr:hypothetical protein [Blastococcus sp. PRF04-17]UOY03725.1 hypothetical protein MVA48_10500 [Blastococcus sp. PRF04-17]